MRAKRRLTDCLRRLPQASKGEKLLLTEFLKESGLSKALKDLSKEQGPEKISKWQELVLNKVTSDLLPSPVNTMVLIVFLRCVVDTIFPEKRDSIYSTFLPLPIRQRDFATRLDFKQELFNAKEIFANYLNKMNRLKEEQDYWALLVISLATNTHLIFKGLPTAVSMLEWDNVDLRSRRIFFDEKTWGKKFPLSVYIDPVSTIILGAWRNKNKKGKTPLERHIFPKTGLKIKYQTHQRYLNKWLGRIYGPGVTWQIFKSMSALTSTLLYSSDVVSYLQGKLYSPPYPLKSIEEEVYPSMQTTPQSGEKQSDRMGWKNPEEEKPEEALEKLKKEFWEVDAFVLPGKDEEMASREIRDEEKYINNIYKRVMMEINGYSISGKKKKLKEAIKVLKEEVKGKAFPEELKQNLLYFLDFAAYFTKAKWKINTLRTYLSHLINIPVDFWYSDFAQMDEEDLNEIFTLFGTLSSLKNYKPALKAFFKFLKEEKGIETQIDWKKLKTEKTINLPQDFITDEKYYKIFRHLIRHGERLKKENAPLTERSLNFALAFAVFLGYRAGLRISEVANLKFKDIWFEGRKIWLYIEKGKTKSAKRKTFVVPSRKEEEKFIEKTVKRYHRGMGKKYEPEENFLLKFSENKDKREPISPSYLSREFSKTCEDLGLGPLRFHLLRHAFASRLKAKGLPTASLLKAMGHLLPDVTYNYYINNLDLIQRKELFHFWLNHPLLEKMRITALMRSLGIAKQSFYVWAKKIRRSPSIKMLQLYLTK